ncbi:MAG: Kae1-associated kinase Bud32, partial [Candidatus Nanoarchaeia archaeon]
MRIAQGAEAIISLENNHINKDRISKGYRLPKLDEKIRQKRTKSEAKILNKAKQAGINTPRIIREDKFSLQLEYINGDKLSDTLNTYPIQTQLELMKKLGRQVTKLHQAN